ncbi:hypothetical protein PRIPAC_80618 [Pristionchus pacificus]|uniref:Uncharacterized protein n=1 Tax=Pristionchus pacificus TaxID=54126 RepID=A0A2A6CK70_PRIPA|nr:hypothetical protein PRIPAC_80618 [Pristionchus pacificus]|eukprot:PDM78453.1 hypothetical protein PRIPAC_31032 [Pristionchus pacificus]
MKPATNQCPMYTQATAADCTKDGANSPTVICKDGANSPTVICKDGANSPTVICKDGAWYTGDPQRPLDNKPTLPLVQPVLLACFGAKMYEIIALVWY